MKKSLKTATISILLAFGVVSTTANADLPPPAFESECVLAQMRNYCKATGQGSSCPVPTHIYYGFLRNCI